MGLLLHQKSKTDDPLANFLLQSVLPWKLTNCQLFLIQKVASLGASHIVHRFAV